MHKYNNQDHAMMTSILTVANICEDATNIWELMGTLNITKACLRIGNLPSAAVTPTPRMKQFPAYAAISVICRY